MKLFILTRVAVQAQVFGAGYPSIPTMTLDEFYIVLSTAYETLYLNP